MMAENLGFDSPAFGVSVTDLLKQFPHVPPRVLVALAFVTLLERTVTPFRLCECGCGESVHGKARLASPACRQRVSRERRAIRAASGRQFNLVIQHEIAVPIPTMPVISEISAPVTADVLTVPAHQVTPYRDGKTILVTGYNHGARRVDGSEPFEVVFNDNQVDCRVRIFKYQASASAKLKIKIDWSRFVTRASHTSQPHEPATRARTFP